MSLEKMALLEQSNNFHRACTVVTGDVLEDFRYILRELLIRVSIMILKFSYILAPSFSNLNFNWFQN
jgi:hypothetical protein